MKEGLKKRLDIFSPVREYPRDMLIASLVFLAFTIGKSLGAFS